MSIARESPVGVDAGEVIEHIAAREGVDPDDLLAGALAIAERCAGRSTDACIDLITADERWTPAEVRGAGTHRGDPEGACMSDTPNDPTAEITVPADVLPYGADGEP